MWLVYIVNIKTCRVGKARIKINESRIYIFYSPYSSREIYDLDCNIMVWVRIKKIARNLKENIKHYNKIYKKLIAQEKLKPIKQEDQGLITYWEKTVANCRKNIDKLENKLNR